jgi:hypothetical protein
MHKNLVVISNVHKHNPEMFHFFYHFLFLDLIKCARMMHKVVFLIIYDKVFSLAIFGGIDLLFAYSIDVIARSLHYHHTCLMSLQIVVSLPM